MYRPSDFALLTDQREAAACKAVASDYRRAKTREMAIQGRVNLFETLLTPGQLAETFGPQTGADAKVMQDASIAARAGILRGTVDTVTVQGPTPEEIIDSAPTVVSLAGMTEQVTGCIWVAPKQRLVGRDPIPTMPLRAPTVVQTEIGPASFPPSVTEIPTFYQQSGLMGYAPTWGDDLVLDGDGSNIKVEDTGVSGWLSRNWGWLALAAAGIAVASQDERGRRG